MQNPSLESLEQRRLFSDYFVAPTGSDSGNGSQAAPWQTLQHAANVVAPGDVVNVGAGKYAGFIMGWDHPQGGKPDAPIVFRGGSDVSIVARNAKTPDGINLENTSNVTLQGFTVAPAADQGAWRSGIRAVVNENVVIRDNTVQMRQTDRYGIYTSWTNKLIVQNNDVSGTFNSVIYTANSSTDPTIKENTVHDSGGNGLHFNGDVSQGGKGVITGAIVEGNTVYNVGNGAGGGAINMDGVQKSRIAGNKLRDNHAKGITLFKGDSAEAATNNVVESNDIRMAAYAKGYALVIKNGSTGNTIIGNILVNASPQGSMNFDPESLKGLRSDHNLINAGVSVDDGDSRLTLAQWQKQSGQDLHSRDSEGDTKAQSVGFLRRRTKYAIALLTVLIGSLIARMMALKAMHRGLHRWLGAYFLTMLRRDDPSDDVPVHLLLCVADHYEPHNGKASDTVARQRVSNWVSQYPRLFGKFHDSDGKTPRHSFFYPMEQYHDWAIDEISDLCAPGFGEIEIHLHHDHDTSAALREKFAIYKAILKRHDLLGRDRETGELKYGFIHGNWALDNSRPDGRWCGVNDELDLLRETGCYCDFTMPSAPSDTQTSQINSIYYAVDDPQRPKSHDKGVAVGSAPKPPRSLMLIQGPLVLNWSSRKWGLFPRIENSCLQGSQPPTMDRLDLWLRARVQVPKRKDWYFVKLHTHGAPEENQKVLLGSAMVRFHEQLAERARKNPNFHYHYVTAREMYNLARAAEAGWTGSVDDAHDFEVLPPGQSVERTAMSAPTLQVVGTPG